MRNKITLMLLSALFSVCVTSCGKSSISPNELPAEIKSFVDQNFPGKNIINAQKESGFWDSEYEVTLADGSKVEFGSNNEWEEIKSKAGVPASLIPASVATYVNKNFPGVIVEKVSKKRYGFKVKLGNDLEIKLDELGGLIETDD